MCMHMYMCICVWTGEDIRVLNFSRATPGEEQWLV